MHNDRTCVKQPRACVHVFFVFVSESVCGPGTSWAAGAPDWTECLPGRGSEKWVGGPWAWVGSQSQPGN